MKRNYNLSLINLLFLLFIGGKLYAQGTYALAAGDKISNQMSVTSVPNITMTYGGSDLYSTDVWADAVADSHIDGFTAVTGGNTQNPKDDAGKTYSAASPNMPTHGTYYVFQPLYDGTLYLAVKCNSAKPFFITEDGAPVGKFNGITYTTSYYGLDTVDVKAGKTYYMFCTGSKLGFFGFTYDSFGTSDPIAALQNKLTKNIESVREMENSEMFKDITVLVQMLDEAALKYEDNISSKDSMTLVSSIDSLSSVVSDVNRIYSEISILKSLISSYADLFVNTSYPGYAVFEAVNNKCANIDYKSEDLKEEDILKATSDLKAAHMAYIYSQEKNADGYIDVTDFVQSPSFHSASSTTSYTSAGWTMDKVSSTSDCSARDQGGRACYNSWSDNFTRMNLYQTISELPNGYYSIKCDGTTGATDIKDQHAYISTTLGTEVSPALAGCDLGSNIWTEQVTPRLYCDNGAMTIGYASTSGGGVVGWFCVTDFQLRYYGEADDEGIAKLYNDEISTATAYAASMHVKGDAMKYQAAIQNIQGKSDKISQLAAMEALATSKSLAEASEAKYSAIMSDGQILKIIGNASTGNYGTADPIVKDAYNKIISYISSESSTYTSLDGYVTMITAYVNNYVKVYNQANNLLPSLVSPTAKKELGDLIDTQAADLISSTTLKSVAEIKSLVATLFDVMQASLAKNMIETNSSESDFTSFIQNPDAGGAIEDFSGWNINRGTGNNYTNYGEHYSGDKSLHYFDSWNATVGKLNYYGIQTVNNIPNGTYRLTFICRTSGDKGAFVFAGTEKDTTWFRIPVQTHTITAGKSDGTDSVFTVYNTYGQIWEEAETAVEQGSATSIQTAEASVNNGIGYGWQWQSIDNIVVDNHQLVLGMTTNSTYTHEAFNGTWFSADNFTLTRTAFGDNSGWNPVSIISSVVSEGESVKEIYTISGIRVNSMDRKGMYVIKQGSKVKKILIR
jgi:hypothetical protein